MCESYAEPMTHPNEESRLHAELASREEVLDITDRKLNLVANRNAAALDVVLQYGQHAGEGHHQTWIIDQMVRALLGEAYAEWVQSFTDGGNYTWHEGIAP